MNRLLTRNGIAFELTPEGRAMRLGPPLVRDAIAGTFFHSGDAETDRLLEDARRLILLPTSKTDATDSKSYGTHSNVSRRWSRESTNGHR